MAIKAFDEIEAREALYASQTSISNARAAKEFPAPIPIPAYNSTTDGLLAAIALGGQACGFQALDVSAGTAVKLTPPAGALIAVIVAEVDATATSQTIAIRLRQDGTDPTATVGHSLGHLGTIDIKGAKNLANTSFVGIQASKVHKLQVQYFK